MRGVLKCTETEAVFIKMEMNNELMFFSAAKCVEKISRSMLYLSKEKLTMNKMLIVFKMQGVFRKYRDWCCLL